MGLGLCDSWEQETVPQEDPGQGANAGCERDGHTDEARGLSPLAWEPLLPAWRAAWNVGWRPRGRSRMKHPSAC